MTNDDDTKEDPDHKLIEEFDDEGNVVKVANLHFIQGILGQGAFGTVRLARRKLAENQSRYSQGKSSTPSPPESLTPLASLSTLPRRRPRRYLIHKSQSAPGDSAFFNADHDDDDDDLSTPDNKRTTSIFRQSPDYENRRQPPSVVGKLGLFIQSRVSFDFDHDDDEDEELVAVKIFSKSILKRRRTMERDKKSRRVRIKTALQQVEREIALMKKLSHPNLVALYEVIDSPESDMLYMVLEYMPLGEILTYQDDGTFRRKDPRPGCTKYQVQGIVNGHFNEEQAALYFVDILHGLAYLHQHHICHRDLKPENILLDAKGIAKVGDFGVSHIFDKESDLGAHRQASLDDYDSADDLDSEESSGHLRNTSEPHHSHSVLTRKDTDAALAMRGMAHYGMLTRTEGTWCFWSPEMCEGSQKFSGYAADMWAAGVCLYIFVTGLLPFYSEVPSELFGKISASEINYSGLGLSESLIDLLKICLEKDPDKRAGVGDCLQHPFLQDARESRIKQLSDEFEKSRTRMVVISEEDIKMAFRIVARVPADIIKSASKTIHSGAKLLQEGFAEAKGRLSMGISTASASSSVSDSVQEKHGGQAKGLFRLKMHSLGSSNHSTDGGDSVDNNHLFHKKVSQESRASEEGGSGDNSSNVPGRVRFTKESRMSSGLSSTCSFGSISAEDLPMILSEEDEMNEDETERGDLPANPSGGLVRMEKLEQNNPDTIVPPMVEKLGHVSDPPEKAPSNNSSDAATRTKRMKRTRDKDSKCVIQ